MLWKAAIGAGLHVGLAEDVSLAGGWLTARGFDGVGAVLMALRGRLNGPVVPVIPVKNRGALVFDDAGIANCGPSAIDFLMADDGTKEVRLFNVDSPLLIIGLAGVGAGGYDREITLEFANGGKITVSTWSTWNLVMSGPIPKAGCDVVLTCHQVTQTTSKSIPRIGGGVVSKEIWLNAVALADMTYVPSNEASRAKGAGAGLTDND